MQSPDQQHRRFSKLKTFMQDWGLLLGLVLSPLFNEYVPMLRDLVFHWTIETVVRLILWGFIQ